MTKSGENNQRARLGIKVTPNAKKSEISGFLEDGSIKIRLNAPPVDGKANAELIKFLAKELDVRKSSVEIVSGFSTRKKIVHIRGIDSQAARDILAAHLQ